MRDESMLEWPHREIFCLLLKAYVLGARSVRGSEIIDAVITDERERLEVAVALESDSPLCEAGYMGHDDASVIGRRRYWPRLPLVPAKKRSLDPASSYLSL